MLKGKVVRIADGDTFTLLTSDKTQVKVRLYGIDAPERGQDFGNIARDKLSKLVFSQQVSVEIRDTDRYERSVGIVYNASGICVNEEMLKAGLAWHFKMFDQNPEWAILEAEARRRKAGLWSHPDPVPPGEWRRK